MATLSPTTAAQETYIADEQVFGAEVLWLSLSFATVLAYAIQRKYFPRTVILRDLPWATRAAEEERSRSENVVVSFLDAMRRTLFMDERTMIKQIGLDGYLTLRLIRFCMQTLTAVSFLNLTILTPVYRYQERSEKCLVYCETHKNTTSEDVYRAECVCGIIDICSMANVHAGSSTLWITASAMLVMTLWVLYRLKTEYKEVVRIRHEFWSSRPSKLHTVFVDRIPRALARPSQLREFFERMFPGQVYSVELVSPTEALRHVGRKRMDTLMQLERAILLKKKYGGQGPRRWILCPTPHSKCFSSVDAIEALSAELDQLNIQFKSLKASHDEMMNEIDKEENTRPRQAFVTFKNIMPTVIAAQTLIQENMALKMAPDPSDVRWDSLGERNTAFTYFLRKLLSRILFALVVLFWGALTSFISALTSREALARQFEGLNEFLLKYPQFVNWVDRLSTLVYVILIATVYPIIALSVRIEVRIAQSNLERAILERYFLFLVVQVFVFYSIAGSVFKSAVDIATNPSHVFSTLSATIPKNASFFIGFIAIKTFWLMFDLVRGYNFIFGQLRRLFWGSTKTTREFRMQVYGCCWHFRFPSPVNLSSANANILLVFFIATSYAVVQPFLTLAGLIYFAAANVCFSTILTTSSRQLFDGGGIFWTHTYWCVIASIITAQLTLVGTLLTKQGFSQALFVFILSIVTMVMASHLNDKYRTPATEVTLEIASALDKFDSDATIRVEEILPDRVLLYQVVSPDVPATMHTSQYNERNDDENVVRVYRYVHPALLDKDVQAPDIEEMRPFAYDDVQFNSSSVSDISFADEVSIANMQGQGGYTRLLND